MKKIIRSLGNYSITKATSLFAYAMARPRFRNINKIIFMAAAKGLGIMNCESSYRSGEQEFTKRFIQPYDNDKYIVLDVGANTGDFAEQILKTSKKLKVIAMEPNPHSSRTLAENMSKYKGRLTTLSKGVSNRIETATLYDYPENTGSSHASLYKEALTEIHGSESYASTTVELTTIDEVWKDIDQQICLIKIDTEGNELKALEGCSQLLASDNKPFAFLLEFNEMNIFSKTTMRDIKTILKDYVAHRILPGGKLIDISEDSILFTELYAYQNIVFLGPGFSGNATQET